MNLRFTLYLGTLILLINSTLFSQTNAGPDQEICTNTTILTADPPPVGYSGNWTIISGSCTITVPTLYNTTITNIIEGFNELKWTISNGINTYEDAVIIINNYPTQAYTAADEEICTSIYTLNANLYGSGESGLWSLVSGSGTIANPTVNATNVTGLSQGINKFEWKITKGICFSKDTITVTNNEVTAYAGPDQTTCNDFTTLNADDPAPGTGTWSVVASSGNPVFGDIYSNVTTITDLGINTNSLQWTVQKGNCTDYANVIITSNKPTTANAGTDQIICDNYTFLSGNNPVNGTGTWTVVSGNGNFVNVSAYNTQVKLVNTGLNKYKWTIEYKGCTSADTVNITYDYFIADAGPDDQICVDTYTLNANNPAPGTGEWRITGGSGTFSNATLSNTQVSGLITGANTFEWKITHGNCIRVDYVTITKNTPSVANAGPDKETCNGETVMAAVSPEVGAGHWSVFSGSGTFTNSLLNNTGVTNIGLNDNIYRWTVEFASCSSFDDVTVTNNFVSANAGTDQIVCGTTSILDANPPQAGETGTWQVLAGTSTVTNSNLYSSEVTGLIPGLNNFRWTISKGSCESYDDITITDNLYDAAASVSGPSDICNDFTSIIGNSPPTSGYGYWSVTTGTGIFDNSVDISTVVRNLSQGTNIIRWTINKDGCENFDEIQINRNSVFADAGTDQNVCVNFATLNGNQPAGTLTGLWTRTSGSGSISNPTLYNTPVTALTSGINTFMWTISGNGCTDSDEVQITNNEFITSAGSNQEICTSYTSLTASDPAPGYGYWEVVSGNGLFSNPSSFNTNISGIPDLSVNVYKWTVFKNGCSDFDEVIVTNNSISADAGTDFNVCSPWATLTGNNPLPGTGVWTIQAGGGNIADQNSPSSQISNLSLGDNIIRWTVTYNTCINYDEVTISNNTVTATAGGDQSICRDYTTLSGQAPAIGSNGLWEVISGNGTFRNATLYNTQVTNLAQGLNTFKWTVFSNGCSSGGDDVIINNKSFTADAGTDQILQQFVTSATMAATLPSGGTGDWILLGGGGDITNVNDPSTTVTNIPSGINEFQWTVSYNGCTAYDVVKITVTDFQPNAGSDKTICLDSLKLNAQDMGGTPQYWTVEEGTGNFDNIYDPATWVKNISEGINRYRWNVTINGATAYDEIIITRINADAGADQIICENFTNLNGNYPVGSISANWSLVSGNANIISPTLYNTQVTNIGGGNNLFLWTVYAPNCSTSDYININYEYLSSNAGNDQILCDDYTTLNAENPTTGSSGIWSVISGNAVFADINANNTDVSNLAPGNNILRWTVYTPYCSATDDITVTNDKIIAYAGTDQIINQDQTYLNAVLPPNSEGVWTVISGSGNFANANNPSTFTDNINIGDNIFRWTVNNNNCSDFDDVTVTYNYIQSVSGIEAGIKVYPNPVNDILFTELSDVDNYKVSVFSITGEKLIEKNSNTHKAKINLSSLPNGIYFIKLNYNKKHNTIKIIKK